MHCRMFSGTAGLYPLDTSGNPLLLVLIIQNIYRHCQWSSDGGGGAWWQKWPEIWEPLYLEAFWYLLCSLILCSELWIQLQPRGWMGFASLWGTCPVNHSLPPSQYIEFKTTWSSPGSVCYKTATLWYLNWLCKCKLVWKNRVGESEERSDVKPALL